jgi:hypothetical protein
MPHFAAFFKAISGQYALHRSDMLGAILKPAVEALESALAASYVEGSCVYFAAVGGRIKIGWSKKVGTRIAQLQTGNAEPIELLGVLPGGRFHERRLHQQFAAARLSGEWFAATPDLLAFIESACSEPRGGA